MEKHPDAIKTDKIVKMYLISDESFVYYTHLWSSFYSMAKGNLNSEYADGRFHTYRAIKCQKNAVSLTTNEKITINRMMMPHPVTKKIYMKYKNKSAYMWHNVYRSNYSR